MVRWVSIIPNPFSCVDYGHVSFSARFLKSTNVDTGFEVLAFPSNDFHQEFEDDTKIAAFVSERYPHSVSHLFQSIHVNGPKESEVSASELLE